MAGMPNLQFLEIGCFEGRSSCWFLNNILTHSTATLTCVDTFEGSHEQKKSIGQQVKGMETLFDQNIATIGAEHRVHKIKGESGIVLRTLPIQFYDFIYIDGSHFSTDVLTDAVLSWGLLKIGGLMLFDDYQWQYYRDQTKNPKVAIDAFTTIFASELNVVEQGYQVLTQKKARERRSVAAKQSEYTTVSISMIRNEADIIEQWARHHCTLMDHMYIVLHECTDNTECILLALQQEGLPITLRYHNEYAYMQHDIVRDLINELAPQSEWVLPLDADEFLPIHSKDELQLILKTTPQETVSRLPWRTYIPNEHTGGLTTRKANEDAQYYKILIPTALLIQKTLRMKPGCHAIYINEELAPTHIHNSLWLAHLPVRSDAQIRQKVSEGYARLLANPRRTPSECWHWENIHRKISTISTPLSWAQLVEIALSYGCQESYTKEVIQDPIALQSLAPQSVH